MQINKQIVFIDSQVTNYQALIREIKQEITVIPIEDNKLILKDISISSNGVPSDNGIVESERLVLQRDSRDSIEQITEILKQEPYSTVHIIAHGSPGCLHIGNTQLSLDTLDKYQYNLRTWANQLSIARQSVAGVPPVVGTVEGVHCPLLCEAVSFRIILLYGCNVAAGDAGAEFIAKLNQITGAEIAASTTPIGHKSLGGNWELDFAVGRSEIIKSDRIPISEAARQSWQGVLATPNAQADEDTSHVTLLPLNLDLAIGNILTNDDLGDAPTRVASVAVQGDSGSLLTLDTPLAEVGLLTPQGGNLVLLGNGTYTYTPPLLVSEFTEVFDYTIIDADGETSTSTLTINGNGAGSPTVIAPSVDLDLDDNNTVNGNFRNVFVTGGAGIGIADLDLGITADGSSAELTEVEVVITNAQAGDELTVDTSLLGALLDPIDASIDTSVAGEYKLTLTPQDLLGGLVTVDSLPASAFVSALAAVEFDTSSTDTTEREISITATDTDGDTSAAVQANIAVSSTADIEPVAEADFNTSNNIIDRDPTTGDLTLNTTTGNVIDNDNPGNTPTLITSASIEGESGSLVTLDTALAQVTLLTTNGGTLLLAANGSYVYTPPTFGSNDPGITEVFNYTITDVDGDTSSNTLTINANGGTPAINDSLTIDLDVNNDNSVNGQFHNVFVIGGSGVAVADLDVAISDSEDPNLELDSVEVVLTNAQSGDELSLSNLPTSITNQVEVALDTSVTGEVKLNLSAVDGTASLAVFQTALASVNFRNTQTNPDTSDRQIEVIVKDSNGEQSTAASASIAVSRSADLLPVANADVNTSSDLLEIDLDAGEVTLNVITGNVLGNDNPGNPLTLVTSASVRGQGDSLVTLDGELAQVTLLTSQGGSLVLAATGDYVYTPPTFGLADPGITEVFNYTITDSDGDTSTTTLTINPVNPNNPDGEIDLIPNAQADTAVALEGDITISNNLLDNDGLGDEPTTVTTATQGSTNIIIGIPFITANSGVLTLAADGSYSYIPPNLGTLPSTGVTETIEYTITDDDGDTSTSTLTIDVEQAAPIANPDNPIAVTGSTVTIDVLKNDRNEGSAATAGLTVKLLDDDGNLVDNLTVEGEGTWSVQGDGTVLFTPVEDLTGDPLPVDYQIIDADGQASAIAQINLDYQDILGGKVAIERVSADDFYIDPDDDITSNYAAYKVTNISGEDITELWVEIDDFAGGNIELAANESNQINLGALASGEATTAFFYLTADSAVTTEQTHTVSAYDGVPEEGIFQGDADFSFTGVADVDPDGNTVDDNTINSISISPSTALPGDTVTVTIDGQTGIIGNDGIISFTPASFTNWNPDIYELTDSSITFTGGNIGTVEDSLLIQAPNADIGQNLPYTATYTFEIAGATDTNTPLSPIANISDGTEIKHTNTGNFDSFDFLPAVTGTGTVAGTVWDDADYDGIFDPSEEEGVANAVINLFAVWNTTTPIETITSDTNDVYQFTNVPAGNYYLEFVQPNGFVTTPEAQDAGGTGLLDSDVNSTTGRTDVFTLAPDQNIENFNIGLTADSDGDGIPNAIEGTEGDRDNDGVPNYLDFDPTGYFYNQNTGDVIVGSSIEISGSEAVKIRSDGSQTGYYQWFINPDFPGVYTIEVTPPEGYLLSPDRAAADSSPLDVTDFLPENPVAIGSPSNESTNKLLSTEFVDNPYYLTFDLAGGDPFIINNNIPFIAPPILDLDITTVGNDFQTSYVRGSDSVSIIDSLDNLSLIDKDDLNLQSATIKLTTRPDGDNAERLLVNGALPDGINTIGYDEDTGILELEGDAPIEDYITALSLIEYSNDIELRESDRLIQISFSDGIYDSEIATSIMEFNEPPDVDLGGDGI